MITAYELLYIIPTTITDNDLGAVEGRVKALLEKHGATLTSTTRLGKFRFAYPIAQIRYGHYILAKFAAEGALVKALDNAFRISSELLRHLIVRAEEAGGDTFDFVQFTEVNLESRERTERPRRRTPELEKSPAESPSSIAAALPKTPRAELLPEEAAPEINISAEELDKKIDAALEENT